MRDEAIVTNVGIVHPRDRMKRILRNTPANISVDADLLKELPYFNAKLKVDELNKKKRRNAVMDKIIKQLPPNNDIYYGDHDRKTDTFRVIKDNEIKIESDDDDDDVEFVKQTPTHPRDSLVGRSKQNNDEVRNSKRLAKKQKGRVVMPTSALLAAGKIKSKYLNKGERTKEWLKHEKTLNNLAKKLKDQKTVKKLNLWIRDNIQRELIDC